MTPEHVSLVRSSWTQLAPIAELAGGLFYDRLFEIYPEVRPLFRGDMAAQGRHLMSMIDIAVRGLDDLAPLLPAVRDLGARHARYGVVDADYDKVGDALLWTLRQGLGAGFTTPVEEAWTCIYGELAAVMKEGAAKVA